ncbi:MAG: glycosyltransferase [Oscillospiraceae bacterium]|nr:glycosyltransferase [Oscillospiraceae bacterium]
MKMRVLIFSTDTGQGHNYTARAVKEYLDGYKNYEVETLILDVLNSGKKNKSKFVSGLYNGMVTRAPWSFGMLYRLGELITSSTHHSPIYWLNSLYADSLYKKITELNPQVIVCPHTFSAQAITKLIEKYNLNIPTMGIITDYTCTPFWEETKLDCYIAATDEVAKQCILKGMDKDKIFPFGLPVCKKFKVKHTKQEARAVFGIPEEKREGKVFALMGGSMGYGRIPKIADELAKRMPDAQILTVCGNNRKIFDKTKKSAEKLNNIIPLQFLDNIDVLMDAADVLLTKPGGLSATEAMSKQVPLVLTLPIPGVEVINSDFIAKMGMAVSANTVKTAADAACRLISNPDECAKMTDAQKKYCNINAAEDIGNLIIKLAERTVQ